MKGRIVVAGLGLAVLLAGPADAHAPRPGKASHHKGVKRAPNGSSKHLHVNCQEDEVAAPKQWRPGMPKKGLYWECVNAEDYVADILANRR